jgi:hypothetical protein
MSDSRQCFVLKTGFTDHLRIVITSNYNVLTALHTSNITATEAHIKSSLHILSLNWLAPGLAAISHHPHSRLFTARLSTENWTRCSKPLRLAHLGTGRVENTFSKSLSIFIMHIRCRGDLFTKPFPSSGRLFLLIKICCLTASVVLSLSIHTIC